MEGPPGEVELSDGSPPRRRGVRIRSCSSSVVLVEQPAESVAPVLADGDRDKEDAYARFRDQFKDSPDMVRNVSPDVLPESYRVKLARSIQNASTSRWTDWVTTRSWPSCWPWSPDTPRSPGSSSRRWSKHPKRLRSTRWSRPCRTPRIDHQSQGQRPTRYACGLLSTPITGRRPRDAARPWPRK